MRDALMKSCKEDKWPAAARDCIVNAADAAAIQACQQQLTPEQRALLQRATTGAPAPVTP
jgi:hypothetical protein